MALKIRQLGAALGVFALDTGHAIVTVSVLRAPPIDSIIEVEMFGVTRGCRVLAVEERPGHPVMSIHVRYLDVGCDCAGEECCGECCSHDACLKHDPCEVCGGPVGLHVYSVMPGAVFIQGIGVEACEAVPRPLQLVPDLR